MTKRMLIDAAHAEETRVVVLNGNRLDDFDFETSTKKQLKGNIYLAKVTRVEPSLQAAFVDFGGNRHGFLAFNEIHPDYYQIPVADRMALLKEEEEEMAADLEAYGNPTDGQDDPAPGNGAAADDDDIDRGGAANAQARGDGIGDFEEVGGEDEAEVDEAHRRARPRRQRYKIQEVIKRRQIILVQVVKEERGNKGAALTTYLSLAGRYCVLMPNTTRGGGISRKITNPKDRKRLKAFVSEFDIPEGVAVILRTAAVERSKAEIKRDFEFLIRTWNQVRETTLESIAPTLVYEEGNLIKRSIRDLYSKDIDEVLVEGDEAYKSAKEFMRMLMPSHAKKVQPYKDETIPMFHRYQVETQIDAMHSPEVQLKSGGYIVINPTEALVSIDVNSGRATRERNIEETAYRTNLEAAEEIARQLKLRDLAGLIVIDFIDMAENRNQHTVERRLKDAMRTDRARIQIGKISPFGLLELSRQRLRPSLIEASTEPCPHCGGAGLVRSTESSALHVLRMVEEEGIRQRSSEVVVRVAPKVGFYILNQKRDMLTGIEARHDLRVMVTPDESLIPPDFKLQRVAEKPSSEKPPAEKAEEPALLADETEATSEEKAPRRRRSRRRKPQQRREMPDDAEQVAAEPEPEPAEEGAAEEPAASRHGDAQDGGKDKPKRRRRGRRGGRRHARSKTAEADRAETPAATKEEPDAATSEPAENAEAAETGGAGVEVGAEIASVAEPADFHAETEAATERLEEPASTGAVAGEHEPPEAGEASEGPAPVGGRKHSQRWSQAEREEPSEPAPAEADETAERESKGGANGADAAEQRSDHEEVQDLPMEREPSERAREPRRRGWWNRVLP